MADLTARLRNDAEPGSLFKAPPPARDKKYLAAIRQLPCLICGVTPCREAAHVRTSFYTLARKPSDYTAVPLCHRHHMEQHNEGEMSWWDRHGIDPVRVAAKLKADYPNIELMTQTVMMTVE